MRLYLGLETFNLPGRSRACWSVNRCSVLSSFAPKLVLAELIILNLVRFSQGKHAGRDAVRLIFANVDCGVSFKPIYIRVDSAFPLNGAFPRSSLC